ncbi:hypothetical protein B566_EDAN005131, partial [Ephemera danica]
MFCFFIENGQLIEISDWLPKLPKSKNETWTPKENLKLTYCVLFDFINTEMIKPGQNNELQHIGIHNGFRSHSLRFGGDMIVCKPRLETLQLEERVVKTFIALSTSPDLNYKYLFNDNMTTIYEEFGIGQEKLQQIRLLESGSMEIDVHENDFRFQLLYMWHLLKVRRRAKQLNSVTQANSTFRFDAFVSYNHRDRDWVHEQLLRSLEDDQHEEVKYALCLHERDFRLGAYIMDNVAECMEMSKHVIVLVQQLLFEKSADFLVLIELQRLSPRQIPSTLRLLMSTRTYLEWPEYVGDLQQFWSRLKH